MYMWSQICKNTFCTSSNTIFSRYFFVLICFLVSVSQGWTPVSDRSGCGRRSLLSGSGGCHHRAHPPLHPGSCSQHLQCHADEPQLCSSNTCAAQLAAPPRQVRIQSDMHSENGLKPSEKWDHTVTVLLLVALRTFADSTPSVLKKTSEWEWEGVSLWSTPLWAAWVYETRRGGGAVAGHPWCRLLTRAVTQDSISTDASQTWTNDVTLGFTIMDGGEVDA